MPREALMGIGAGLASAAASLAFIAGIPFSFIFLYFSPLPLIAVGLMAGSRVTVVASIVCLLVTASFGGFLFMLTLNAGQTFAAILVVYLSLVRADISEPKAENTRNEWYPIGRVIAYLSICGVVFLCIVATFTATPGLSVLVSSYVGEAIKIMSSHVPQMKMQGGDLIGDVLATRYPGFVGANWIIMICINSSLAQAIAIRTKKNLRPKPSYLKLDLPLWLSWPFIIGAAITLTGTGEFGYLGRNATILLATPYFLLGLAVLHSLAQNVLYRRPILIVFYIILLGSLKPLIMGENAWPILFVTSIGVLENWIGLRMRIKRTPS